MRRMLASVLLAASLGCASSGESSRTQEVRASSGHLPIEEVRTRQAIAATRQDQLLGASGRELELQLLLIQNEALTYMAHLADTLSRSEPDPARLAFVRELWRDMTRLQEDVLGLIRRPAPMRRS